MPGCHAVSQQQAAANSAFGKYVNVAARELELWLATDASAAAGAGGRPDAPEIVRLLRTPAAERTDNDALIMCRVVQRIQSERARRPDGDIVDSPWRHRLMNCGHDPLTWSPAPTPSTAVASAGRAAPVPRPGDPPKSRSS